jgi:hypothetical protein
VKGGALELAGLACGSGGGTGGVSELVSATKSSSCDDERCGGRGAAGWGRGGEGLAGERRGGGGELVCRRGAAWCKHLEGNAALRILPIHQHLRRFALRRARPARRTALLGDLRGRGRGGGPKHAW